MKKITLFLLVLIIASMTSQVAQASSLSTTVSVTTSVARPAVVDKASPRTMSRNGQFMVFASGASDLVPHDTNNASDIFLYDRITHRTQLITQTASGVLANGASEKPTISADGRYIAFVSFAKNILPNPQDVFCGGQACRNIYVFDRQTHNFILANRSSVGLRIGANETLPHMYGPVLSADGRQVIFRTTHALGPQDTNNADNIAIRDLQANVTRIGDVDDNGLPAADGSSEATLSDDGRFLAFTTFSALVPQDTNETYDIYLRDIQNGTTTLVSQRKNSGPADRASYQAVISGNGRFISYLSRATNIVDGDTNEANDLFLYDTSNSTTRRINTTSRGVQAIGETYQHDISYDGRFLVYMSGAANLALADTNYAYDIFLFDRQAQLTRRVNRASADGVFAEGGSSFYPSISGDGRAVSFISDAKNLTPGGQTALPKQLYLTFNPVVTIPFYDSYSVVDLYY